MKMHKNHIYMQLTVSAPRNCSQIVHMIRACVTVPLKKSLWEKVKGKENIRKQSGKLRFPVEKEKKVSVFSPFLRYSKR